MQVTIYPLQSFQGYSVFCAQRNNLPHWKLQVASEFGKEQQSRK